MTEHTTSHPSGHDRAPSWWRASWPLDGKHAAVLIAALAVVILAGVAIGELLTNWSAVSAIPALDEQVAEGLANDRTPMKNDLAHWAALLADTPVKIALSLALVSWLLWRYRRWHEAVMVGLPLVFEATAFIIITTIVGRPRPDVERLLDSPVNSSFPSGHVAAATVYAAIAVVVFWHARQAWLRVLAMLGAVLIPLGVAWARMYQGMHFLSDVVAGVVLGAVSVVVIARLLGHPPTDEPARGLEEGPGSQEEAQAVA